MVARVGKTHSSLLLLNKIDAFAFILLYTSVETERSLNDFWVVLKLFQEIINHIDWEFATGIQLILLKRTKTHFAFFNHQ